jgi:hypothetical protein
MKFFESIFRLAGGTHGNTRPRLPSRPAVEALEARLAPANVFVVPFGQTADASHFHTLAEALVAAGTDGDVRIEPGAVADASPVTISQTGVTVEGHPNVPANILPVYDVTVVANMVSLRNLNIGSLTIGPTHPADSIQVNRCLVNEITALTTFSTFNQNIITGSVEIGGGLVVNGIPAASVNIANNTFSSTALTLLTLREAGGTVVKNNAFFAPTSTADGGLINVVDSGAFQGTPTTIANNVILSETGTGISVSQDGNAASDVKILNNRIEITDTTAHIGIGLRLRMEAGDNAHFRAYVEGNDFHNNNTGVFVRGDGTLCGTIDFGGGALGSLGGNNFRSFVEQGTLFGAAIVLAGANSGSISAQQNIFSNNLTPSSVVFTETGSINVGGPLGSARAFVQTLYNEVLGRTGRLAELDPWVNVLGSQGQNAVSDGIRRSPEALGRVVDQLYIRFLGRESDSTGRAGWIGFLQSGGTLEQVETLFLTSPEYLRHINTDFVQSLYLNILGRTGSSAELALWNNNIQNVGGLAGVANAFVRSPENRLNSLRTDFQTFLHRTPTDSELAPLVNAPLDLLGFQGLVLSSPEFFTRG